eukprot:Sspe_Gene.9191::Locus_3098_Transcript_1_3_Confidence_0.500_Length_4433::g.9191::m.9191/K11718/HUGT; UDP-glucose:glycoprotein glucosyltransferase
MPTEMRGGSLLLVLLALGCPADGARSIRVSLQAGWPETSLAAEAAELVAEMRPARFWDFVDNFIAADTNGSTARDTVTVAEAVAGDLLPRHLKGILTFGLAVRYSSPRVEVYRDLCGHQSPTATVFDGKEWRRVLSPDALKAVLKGDGGGEVVEAATIHPFDHVFEAGEGETVAVVCFALNSPDAAEWHTAGKEAARYVLRHLASPPDSPRLVVQGYGVNLAIKNMEYKAVDDRHAGKGDDEEAVQQDDEGTERYVAGLNFNLLRSRRPDLAAVLGEFEEELLEEAGDEEGSSPSIDLAIHEIQQLGAQATYRILRSGHPLETMNTLASDFPNHAASLSKTRGGGIKRVAKATSELTKRDWFPVEAGGNSFVFGGREIPASKVSPFTLIRRAIAEFTLLDSIATTVNAPPAPQEQEAWGKVAHEMVKPSGEVNDPWATSPDTPAIYVPYVSPQRLRVDPALVDWTNNIEEDRDYADWPRALRNVHSSWWPPRQRGMRYPRRNVHSSIFVVRPHSRRGLAPVTAINRFKMYRTPARLGILFDTTKDTTGVGRLVACTYRTIASKNVAQGLRFLQSLSTASPDDILLEDQVVATAASFGAQTTAECDIVPVGGLIGELPPPAALIHNGVVLAGKPADNLFYYAMYREQQVVRALVASSAIRDSSTDLLSDMLVHHKAVKSLHPSIHLHPRTYIDVPVPATLLTMLGSVTWLPGTPPPARATTIVVVSSPEDALQPLLVNTTTTRLGLIGGTVEATEALLMAEQADDPRKALLGWAKGDVVPSGYQTPRDALQSRYAAHRKLAEVFGCDVVCNGRKVLRGDLPLMAADYDMLSAEEAERGEAIRRALVDLKWDSESCREGDPLADKFFVLAALHGKDVEVNKPRSRVVPQITPKSCPSPCRIGFAGSTAPKGDMYTIPVALIANPLSLEAQRAAPVLQATLKAIPLDWSVYLNPAPEMSSIPLKSFYRYAISSEPRFMDDGSIAPPHVLFSSPPRDQVLTLGIDEPEGMITEQHAAPADATNIRLDAIAGKIVSFTYKIRALIITGSARDESLGQPQRGIPLEVGSRNTTVADTLVMSNYGYYQLPVPAPGSWEITARAKEVYQPLQVTLPVTSWEGRDEVDLVLRRLPGKESVDVPQLLFKAPEPSPDRPTLNIFSLASGHLYERFLKVMIHTVLQQAKGEGKRVKFWLLSNFLSPEFKETIPKLAEGWGFQYQLVTYKWPHWLTPQTEMQRIIWAYKVLFLDVLFPLDLEKVIFVDADQVVRSDLHELYNMDLKGHAVAYTPFCQEHPNKDTLGFRFWNQGFWENHLAGKPYHISALYVVDLTLFRRIGAGDSYRATYDGLAQDPNSLANLDQDLPNYMQNQIPIFSLPEEWLWCEAWCSMDTLKKAKTIDLCNNPLTKIPKLENAKRIVPEWVEYDAWVSEWEKSHL